MQLETQFSVEIMGGGEALGEFSMTGPFLIQLVPGKASSCEQSQAQILWRGRVQWAMQLMSDGFHMVTEAKTLSPRGLMAGSREHGLGELCKQNSCQEELERAGVGTCWG